MSNKLGKTQKEINKWKGLRLRARWAWFQAESLSLCFLISKMRNTVLILGIMEI